MTAPARRGFLARFEREVDPHSQLDPAERTLRARRAMRAYMLRLAATSARVRARKAAASVRMTAAASKSEVRNGVAAPTD